MDDEPDIYEYQLEAMWIVLYPQCHTLITFYV